LRAQSPIRLVRITPKVEEQHETLVEHLIYTMNEHPAGSEEGNLNVFDMLFLALKFA
jgi:hypothetical protein